MNKRHTVVMGVCASIAAYKACDIINRLRQEGVNVVACMSKDADKFITPLTLQALSCNRVFKDMFEARRMDPFIYHWQNGLIVSLWRRQAHTLYHRWQRGSATIF